MMTDEECLDRLGFRVEGLFTAGKRFTVIGFCKRCGVVLSRRVLDARRDLADQAGLAQKSNADATVSMNIMRKHACRPVREGSA